MHYERHIPRVRSPGSSFDLSLHPRYTGFMNIFVLSNDPREAAQQQCDRHVVKMILESAQMLSTVCHQHGAPAPYKATHPHHPCTLWAGECEENYLWLHQHLEGLLEEYTRRYGKTHKTHEHLAGLLENRPTLPKLGACTPFAQAMPEPYRVPDDPVSAYRNYYKAEKSAIAKWKHGNVPPWFGTGS
jgi:hypothetical protein